MWGCDCPSKVHIFSHVSYLVFIKYYYLIILLLSNVQASIIKKKKERTQKKLTSLRKTQEPIKPKQIQRLSYSNSEINEKNKFNQVAWSQVKDKGGEFKFKFWFIDNLFPKLSRKQDYFKFQDANEDSKNRSPDDERYEPTRQSACPDSTKKPWEPYKTRENAAILWPFVWSFGGSVHVRLYFSNVL